MRLFWLGLAWLAGIGLARFTELSAGQWLILSSISLLSLILFRQQKFFLALYALILMFSLGAARYQSSLHTPDPEDISWYNDTGTNATITGVVIKPPDVRDSYIGLQVDAETLRFGGPGNSFPIRGRILARATRFEDWAYGDRVLIQGPLETPPEFETFDYRAYLSQKDIHSIVPYASVRLIESGQGNPITALIYDLRSHALNTIESIFPDPEAALLSGILVGMESSIPPEVQADFNKTGTTHIIAISGFNITIIAAIFMSLFRRILGTRKGLITAGIGIFIYTVLVGAEAAVVRAAIMGALTLIATRLGRQTYGFASLSAAAILMTVIDPDVLWDVGFQLSFAATMGLMVFTPPLERGFSRFAGTFVSKEQAEKLTPPVSEFVLYTVAAQLMTLPLSAMYFQQLSLTSFIANPVILPAQPLLMITGGLATVAGMIWMPLGRALAIIAWPFPAFTIRAVSFFAQSPTGNFNLTHQGPLFAAVWYFILVLLILFIYLPKERRPQIKIPSIQSSTSVVALLVLSLLMNHSLNDKPDGKLHISILDVGTGVAALIQTPEGRYILIDGGPSPIALSDALGRRLPLFFRKLDWLILTGTKDEQLGGLAEVIPRFPPSHVLLTGPPRTGAYRYVMDNFAEAGIPISNTKIGQSFTLANDCRLSIFNLSDQGASLLVSYGDFRFLYAPSADPTLTEQVSDLPRSVTAVLLPDGGSELVNRQEWLATLDPRMAIVSVGAGNSRGLPSESVLKALEGRTVLRTDLNGTIDIITDGEHVWVEVEQVTPGE